MSIITCAVLSSSSYVSLPLTSLTRIILFSSTAVIKSLVLLAKRVLTVSKALVSFSCLVSIIYTTLLTSVSICSFSALVYISTRRRLSRRRFLIKLSLSNLSLYATKRFCIWKAASFPTIYTSSLVPLAIIIYSRFPSSSTLKN